jgi:cytochrome c peroxidase
MNNKDMAQVVAKLRKAPYQDLFTKAFGANVLNQDRTAFHAMATAIAAYEKSPALNPFNSKFDAVLAGRETWTEKEALGFELFKNPEKGNCLACHVGNVDSQRPEDWLFTDFTYDNLGVPRNETIAENRDPQFFDLGLCRQAHLKTPVGFDSESLCGAFKVPTLRNVAKTAPYMHNGIFKDLKTVVRFYVTRSTHPELWYPKKSDGSLALFDDIPEIYRENVNQGEAPYDRKVGEQPRLTEEEIDAVVSFMETLSDR